MYPFKFRLSFCYLLLLLISACATNNNLSQAGNNQVPGDAKYLGADSDSKNIRRVGDVPEQVDNDPYGIQCLSKELCWLQTPNKLWQSVDGGKHWRQVQATSNDQEPRGFFFINQQAWWSTSRSDVYKTIDGGIQWKQQTTPLDAPHGEINSVWFSKDGKTGWLSGGLYRKKTQEELKNGVPNTASDSTGEKVIEEALFRTDDGGQTWQRTKLPQQRTGKLSSVSFFDSMHGIAIGDVIYYTADGGSVWELPRFPSSCVSEKYQSDYYDGTPESVAILDSKQWWLAFSDGRIATTTDGGQSWCDLAHAGSIAFNPRGRQFFTDLHFASATRGWGLGWDNYVYQTEDGGRNWSRVNSKMKFDSMHFFDDGQGLLVSKEGVFTLP